MYNCLNSLKWKCFWQLNCVLMLNWTVFNRTDYLHKNGFGVKITYKGWYAIKPNKQTNKHIENSSKTLILTHKSSPSSLSKCANITDSFDSLSLSSHLCRYWSLFFTSLQDGIQCSHRANEYKFLQVDQHWCVHL